MAIHKFNPATKHEVLLFPYPYLAVSGNEANPTTASSAAPGANTDNLAKDESGRPKTEFQLIKRSEERIFYETQAEYDAMSAANKAKAFWIFGNTGLRQRYIDRGVLVPA